MRAVVFRECGPPSVLELAESWEKPKRGKGQLLIEVHATSVNPVDCKTRRGELKFMTARPKVLGGDVAGVVVEADEGSRFPPGTRVALLSDGFSPSRPYGSYAEFIAVPEAHTAALPGNMSFEDAAGLPLVALTVLQAFDPLDLQPGQRVLIHAGAGGVGSVAIQVAKARGLHVTTTCSERNHKFVTEELGADVAIDYNTHRFEEVCKEQPFDCVLDLVGGEYEGRSMSVLKPRGWYVSVLAKTSFWPIIKGKLRGWLGLGPRYHLTLVQPSGQQMETVLALVKEGKLKPIVDRVLPLAEAREAHESLERGHTRGKTILKVKET